MSRLSGSSEGLIRCQSRKLAKKNGVSEATVHTWRKRFGEMEVDDVRHLKQLEQKNGRLNKLLAEARP